MATPVTMPKLGLTMNSGSISKWNKKEGDTVRKGDILLVVATDKLTFEVEAPEEGTLLKIVVPEGKDVPVGETIAYMGATGEKISETASPVPAGSPTAPTPGVSSQTRLPTTSERREGLRATPLARKTARDAGVDIALVPGSGPAGRVVRKDVESFAAQGGAKVKTSPVAAKMAADLGVDVSSLAVDGRVMKADVLQAVKGVQAPSAQDVRMPLTPMRKVIGQRMSLSSSTIPSVSFDAEVDFTALKAFRAQVKAEGEKKGVSISYNHILMKICAAAMGEYPLANASINGDELVLHGNANIGLAVAVQDGLLVPNVKGVQAKGLLQIAAETQALVEKARSGKLVMEDMSGGTFTITNLGMYGMQRFIPIINPPEACILGVSAITDRPVVVDGAVVIRPVCVLTLVADHRILNGAEAAEFLARVRSIAENPYLLLL